MAISTIKRSVMYPHSIEKVWRAISSAEALSAWLMPTDFKPVVGHTFTFRTRPAPGFGGVVHGEVLVVDPPHHLVMSWRGGPLLDSTVSFRLEAVADGTQLILEHSGFTTIRTLLPRFVLGLGWRDLLNNKLLAYMVGQGA